MLAKQQGSVRWQQQQQQLLSVGRLITCYNNFTHARQAVWMQNVVVCVCVCLTVCTVYVPRTATTTYYPPVAAAASAAAKATGREAGKQQAAAKNIYGARKVHIHTDI